MYCYINCVNTKMRNFNKDNFHLKYKHNQINAIYSNKKRIQNYNCIY